MIYLVTTDRVLVLEFQLRTPPWRSMLACWYKKWFKTTSIIGLCLDSYEERGVRITDYVVFEKGF